MVSYAYLCFPCLYAGVVVSCCFSQTIIREPGLKCSSQDRSWWWQRMPTLKAMTLPTKPQHQNSMCLFFFKLRFTWIFFIVCFLFMRRTCSLQHSRGTYYAFCLKWFLCILWGIYQTILSAYYNLSSIPFNVIFYLSFTFSGLWYFHYVVFLGCFSSFWVIDCLF